MRELLRKADAALYSELHQAPLFLSVNGARVQTLLPRATPLLSFLRNDCSLNGPKFGCGLGECGTCSILIDGQLARACVLTLGDAAGRAVTTLEGLAANGRLDPVQEAFIACAAAQCGYCLNGMIMTARALIDVNPDPSDADIREALRFNLCRCGAHVEIIAAVRLAATLARA
jgi:nicotinate dehydrogenase subunit A